MGEQRFANSVLAVAIAAVACCLAWSAATSRKGFPKTEAVQPSATAEGPRLQRAYPIAVQSPQLARTPNPKATTRASEPSAVRRESAESGHESSPATLRPHVAAQRPVVAAQRLSGAGSGDDGQQPNGQALLDRSLLTARSCWLEAGFSLPDCAAIVGVITARAERSGWTYERMLWAYTALDAKSPRAAFARALPDDDVPSWTRADNARWYELRAIATDALEGGTPSPCEARTSHWGGMAIASDAERANSAIAAGRWRKAKCRARLVNRFFVELAPRKQSSRSTLAAAEARPQ